VFNFRKTLSSHSACPRKIPGYIMYTVLICENFSVNKRAYRKKVKLHLVGFCLFSFLNFTFVFHAFHLKKLKIIPYDFWTGVQKKMEWWTVKTKDCSCDSLIVCLALMFLKLAYLPLKLCLLSRDFQRFSRTCPKVTRTLSNTFWKFPKIPEDFWRLPDLWGVSIIHQWI